MSLGFPAPRTASPAAPAAIPRDPELDAQRALMAQAFFALIDATLDAPHPLRGAEGLLKRITASGLGIVTSGPDQMKLVLFNITATSGPSCTALLRNWQTAAVNRIAAGVRA